MIAIRRVAEPDDLKDARARRLPEARTKIKAGEKAAFVEYDVVKPALAAMQHLKCCYCEKREEQAKYRDVEHYRPKSVYWWLAWTWENLLFSCIDCNREQKKNAFPLSPGDVPLFAENSPPGAENPMVIDPSLPGADPTREIAFRSEKIDKVQRWIPRGLTPRGKQTVATCGLDRPALLDFYGQHVNQVVRPKVENLQHAVESGDPRAVTTAWSSVTRSLLAARSPFAALSHDALHVLVTSRQREDYKLAIPRPAQT